MESHEAREFISFTGTVNSIIFSMKGPVHRLSTLAHGHYCIHEQTFHDIYRPESIASEEREAGFQVEVE